MKREVALKIVLAAVGFLFLAFSLSLDHVSAARPWDVDDVQHLCHAQRFLASRNPQPIRESQPHRFYCMVEFGSCRRYGHSGNAEHGFTLPECP